MQFDTEVLTESPFHVMVSCELGVMFVRMSLTILGRCRSQSEHVSVSRTREVVFGVLDAILLMIFVWNK